MKTCRASVGGAAVCLSSCFRGEAAQSEGASVCRTGHASGFSSNTESNTVMHER